MMNPEPAGGNARAPQTVTDDSPWYLKYGVRFLGSCSALASLALGAMACITITPRCLLAGILQMLNGVIVALIEAPCLCLFLDFAQVPSTYFDSKPPWHRGILYVVFYMCLLVYLTEPKEVFRVPLPSILSEPSFSYFAEIFIWNFPNVFFVTIISILPISLCATISTYFGSGLVFVTGILYGMIALGKKAPAEQMRMQASSSYNLLQNSQKAGDVESGSTLPKSSGPPKSGVI